MIAKGRTLFTIFHCLYFLYGFIYSFSYGPYVLFISGYTFYLITAVFGLCLLGDNYVNFGVVDNFEAYYVYFSCIVLLSFLYYSLYDPKIFKNINVLNIIGSVGSLGTIKSILKMFYLTHVEKKRIIVEEIEKSFKAHNI
ncbi:hypothetical protein EFN37_09265 [Leuconostoc mesenteroides]|jgi:hypothetical protein|nr:hypothetical protein [Leuconostoc mesenteroides]